MRYPKDPAGTKFSENKYLDQYRDLKLFYKEYNGESLLHPFKNYPDMMTLYPIQVIDLRFQIDYLTPKKIRLFEEFETAPENTNLYVILIKHRETNMVSDGNKITGMELIPTFDIIQSLIFKYYPSFYLYKQIVLLLFAIDQ